MQQLHRGTLHRACIVLGDLARYVEMYRADTGKKSWLGAELWYALTLTRVLQRYLNSS